MANNKELSLQESNAIKYYEGKLKRAERLKSEIAAARKDIRAAKTNVAVARANNVSGNKLKRFINRIAFWRFRRWHVAVMSFVLVLVIVLPIVIVVAVKAAPLNRFEYKKFKANATYYLSQDGSDNEGDGTKDKPWYSIKYALENTPLSGGHQIVVKAGYYEHTSGVISRQFEKPVLVISEKPYKAVIRHANKNRVLYVTNAKNILFAGFEFVGRSIVDGRTGSFAENAYLMQIEMCENVGFENNIIHDSYENDVVKLNNFCKNCFFRGNIMYNPQPRGGHQIMDINNVNDTIIEDNIFFIDYVSSGRTEPGYAKRENDPDTYGQEATQGNPSGFIVIKSSVTRMRIEDGKITVAQGAEEVTNNITIARNIFYNYVGQTDYSFIILGEDGQSFDEVKNAVIENNLFVANEPVNKTRTRGDDPLAPPGEAEEAAYYSRMAPIISVKSASYVTIRANTVTGWFQSGWHGSNSVGATNGFFIRIGHEHFDYTVVQRDEDGNIIKDEAGKDVTQTIPYTWQSNDHLVIENNIIQCDLLQNGTDWTGTHKKYVIMGLLAVGKKEYLEDSFINNNLFWDAGTANNWNEGKNRTNQEAGVYLYELTVPEELALADAITYAMDENKIVADSLIEGDHSKGNVPLLYLKDGKINGGYKTIEKARLAFAKKFAKPKNKTSPAYGAASSSMPKYDIMYKKRTYARDIGAFEQSQNYWYWWTIGGIGLVGLGIGTFYLVYFIKRKKRKTIQNFG
ncbi:MAG: hypothetical protein LBQ05_02235 [Christensenellaceae bacterium]|jgi:hypothetical protein|nr:hypothetical protein [Christensenellaceae bacterium]